MTVTPGADLTVVLDIADVEVTRADIVVDVDVPAAEVGVGIPGPTGPKGPKGDSGTYVTSYDPPTLDPGYDDLPDGTIIYIQR